MTLVEVYEASQRRVLGLADFQWPCFGEGRQAVILGREDQHWGTAVVNAESLEVLCLDMAQWGWWCQAEHRSALLEWLDQKDLHMEGPELTESEALTLLAEQP